MSMAGPRTSHRRTNHRFRIGGKGRILFGRDFAHGVDCVIADRSATGAKLQVPRGGDIPSEFVLIDHLSRTCTLCRVVRREPYAVGVRLLSVLDPQMAAGPELEVLWARMAESAE